MWKTLLATEKVNAILRAAITDFIGLSVQFTQSCQSQRSYSSPCLQGSTEEIDLIKRGANYGWSYCEGTGEGSRRLPGFDYSNGKLPCSSVFEPPLLSYSHNSIDGHAAAVIGGYVYRAARNKCLQVRFTHFQVLL